MQDERAVRAELAAKGFKNVVRVEWAPNEVHETHSHDFPVYVRVLAGSMVVECAGEKRPYKEGDLVTLKPDEPHIERVGPNGIILLSARG